MSRKPATKIVIAKTYVTGADVTVKPVRNTTPLSARATDLTRATVQTIARRRTFTDGKDLVSSVTTTINSKFPQYTRNRVRLAVYKALEQYFS